jgi:hypothetical protein
LEVWESFSRIEKKLDDLRDEQKRHEKKSAERHRTVKWTLAASGGLDHRQYHVVQAIDASATGDDHRLALLKAGHWRIIEKTIRELADPPKSNPAIKLTLPASREIKRCLYASSDTCKRYTICNHARRPAPPMCHDIH